MTTRRVLPCPGVVPKALRPPEGLPQSNGEPSTENDGALRAFWESEHLWKPGRTIRIKFKRLPKDIDVARRIQTIANTWTKYANLVIYWEDAALKPFGVTDSIYRLFMIDGWAASFFNGLLTNLMMQWRAKSSGEVCGLKCRKEGER